MDSSCCLGGLGGLVVLLLCGLALGVFGYGDCVRCWGFFGLD